MLWRPTNLIVILTLNSWSLFGIVLLAFSSDLTNTVTTEELSTELLEFKRY